LTNIGASDGLLRQYFPKSTDLHVHDADGLAAVAAELNARPRKTLGWKPRPSCSRGTAQHPQRAAPAAGPTHRDRARP
jgi:IS30 family transposase